MILKDGFRGLGYVNLSNARNEVSRLGTRALSLQINVVFGNKCSDMLPAFSVLNSSSVLVYMRYLQGRVCASLT
jgi:hypothetical protein